MHRCLRLLLVALVLSSAACGGYARRSDRAEGPPNTQSVEVGEGLETITTRARNPRPAPAPGEEDTATEDTSVAANQSSYDSPEGFRLILTVDGSRRYRETEDIKLSVLVRNVSNKDLQFDPNDLRNFAFRPFRSAETAWTDGDCRGARVPKAVETSAQTLRPNEQTTFVDVYPGPDDAANRDSCRVNKGAYSVFGFVAWCPPGSTDGRGVCDPSRTRQIVSAGVRIDIA